MRTLKDIKIGEECTVIKIIAVNPLKRRFMDMGITAGVKVLVQMEAPLSDPIAIRVRGYELAIRRSDAALIIVA